MPSTAEDRSFYEAKWVESDLSAGSIRNYLVRKERFFVRQLRDKRGHVLDLGCGGGWRLYTRSGPVVGVDLSPSSAHSALRLYQGGVAADLGALPFTDGSFDIVVSTDVLGHVLPEDKDAVLSEIKRVLRPGGYTLHYVEADGNDPLMRFAKKDELLYWRYVVSPEGHVGLESAGAIAARFRAAGFLPEAELPAYRGLMYVGRVVQYFDNEYARRSSAIKALVAICKLLTAAAPVEMASNLLIACLMEIGDRLFPESWAGGMLICYQKPA